MIDTLPQLLTQRLFRSVLRPAVPINSRQKFAKDLHGVMRKTHHMHSNRLHTSRCLCTSIHMRYQIDWILKPIIHPKSQGAITRFYDIACARRLIKSIGCSLKTSAHCSLIVLLKHLLVRFTGLRLGAKWMPGLRRCSPCQRRTL